MPTDSPTIPRLAVDQITFCGTHIPVWGMDPVSLGLSAPMVAELATLTDAARAAFADAEAARQASMAATIRFHTAIAAMRGQAADMVMLIRTHAKTTHNDNVYAAAHIDPPAPRTPSAPPGRPTSLSLSLGAGGAITLSWKSKNSAPSTGAYFQVQRRLAGESTLTNIGGVAGREFVDATIPVGATGASYIVTGYRGKKRGESSVEAGVQFGGGGVGARVRMAA